MKKYNPKMTIPNAITIILLSAFGISGIAAIFTWRQTVLQNEVFTNISRISMYTAQNATTILNTSSSIQHNLRLMLHLQMLIGDSWGSVLEIREFYETEIRSIERMVNTNPLLRNIRIYIDREGILELFPVVYNMSRAGNSTWVGSYNYNQNRWYFNYADITVNTPLHHSEENLVAGISGMRINNHLVILEVAASMDDFIPGLFSEATEDSILVFVDINGKMHYSPSANRDIDTSDITYHIDFNGGFQTWQGLIGGVPMLMAYMPIDTPLVGGILEIRNISNHRNITWLISFLFMLTMLLVGYLFLKISMNENMKKEIAAKDAQIMSLNNQIDSHFLYNTLESIKMLAEINQNYHVSDAITSLGKIFRHNLGRNTKGETTLEAEIEYVQEYMALANLRFDYEVPVLIDIEEGLMKTIVPRMTLQPIVENSITHGQRCGLAINISAHRVQNSILIEVKDNGLGIEPQTLEKLRLGLKKGKANGEFGLGLLNMYQRLIIHYGKDCSVVINSNPGSFTCVVITIGTTINNTP